MVPLRAVAGLLQLAAIMGALLFGAAGTLHYVEAWIFLAVFCASSAAVTAYLAAKDPALLERRVNAGPAAEKERTQKLVQLAASAAFLATLVVPALDRRWSWSRVPPAGVAAGDLLVLAGFVLVFRVFRENTFTSAIIEVGAGQRVIDTGPYARVRHPMYAGALVLLAGIPLALGSTYGLLTLAPMLAAIVWRLLDEERFLAARLPGYDDYRRRVPYRLVPRIW